MLFVLLFKSATRSIFLVISYHNMSTCKTVKRQKAKAKENLTNIFVIIFLAEFLICPNGKQKVFFLKRSSSKNKKKNKLYFPIILLLFSAFLKIKSYFQGFDKTHDMISTLCLNVI